MTIISKTKFLEFKSAKSPANKDWYYVRRTNDTASHDSAVVITTLIKTENGYDFLLFNTNRPPLSAENKAKYCLESPAGLIGDVDKNEDDVVRNKKSKNADMAISVIKTLLKPKLFAIDDMERAYLQVAQNNIPMMSPSPVKKLGTKLHELMVAAAMASKAEGLTPEDKTHIRNKLFVDVMEELKKYEIYWRPAKDDPVLSDMTKVREIILSKCFVGE